MLFETLQRELNTRIQAAHKQYFLAPDTDASARVRAKRKSYSRKVLPQSTVERAGGVAASNRLACEVRAL